MHRHGVGRDRARNIQLSAIVTEAVHLWHLPRHRREFTDQQKLLRKIFGLEDEKVETICGINVDLQWLAERETYLADKGRNPDRWCPLCFGA